MIPRIDQAWPRQAIDLDDEALLALYARDRPWLRVNFVSSLDGAATRNGTSGGLSPAADRRVFDALRRLCDVVVVGAGTARAEGYTAMRVDAASAAWRRAHGFSEHPVLCLVSAHLDLDPRSPIFQDAPIRPVILTVSTAPADRRSALAEVADLVDAGDGEVDAGRARAALIDRGLGGILCEGGPHLFGAVLAADAADELCLTLSPTLEAGDAPRIASGALPEPRGMSLGHVLVGGDALLLSYRRDR
jgi:riboflavin biosynthesis pyrimidine reductase